jgi:hypothetical protein
VTEEQQSQLPKDAENDRRNPYETASKLFATGGMGISNEHEYIGARLKPPINGCEKQLVGSGDVRTNIRHKRVYGCQSTRQNWAGPEGEMTLVTLAVADWRVLVATRVQARRLVEFSTT